MQHGSFKGTKEDLVTAKVKLPRVVLSLKRTLPITLLAWVGWWWSVFSAIKNYTGLTVYPAQT